MTDAEPAANQRKMHLWLALGIALAALLLRLSLINFPTGSHQDEPIIANLTQRFVEQGILTADWAGFNNQSWSHPTYQFSPYTLVQSLIAKFVHALSGSPRSLDGYILLARAVSCCWGSLAVLLVFFLGRTCFSVGAALLSEATLATCFLHIQDSIYARVDTFLSCLVLLSLLLTFQTLKRPGSFRRLAATSFVMGLDIAAKYNVFPVLVFIPLILLRWERTRAISRRRAVVFGLASLGIVGAGFIGGTPELLWRPGPLIAGMRYELNHYSTGHIPHEAHDWGDSNFFYWPRYLVWLGLGWLPTLGALLFIARIVRLRRWEDFMLGTFLIATVMLFLVTKVRFERNLEICLGALTLAAGVTAWDWVGWLNKRQNPVKARYLGIAFIALWFSQPLRVLYHFRETLNYRREWKAQVDVFLSGKAPAGVIPLLNTTLTPESAMMRYDRVMLVDYGDLFSADAALRWKQFFRADPASVLTSPWEKYHYPFSTVNIYHGPLRTLVYQKETKPPSIEPVKPNAAAPASK